jgi:hypothetical protein
MLLFRVYQGPFRVKKVGPSGEGGRPGLRVQFGFYGRFYMGSVWAACRLDRFRDMVI